MITSEATMFLNAVGEHSGQGHIEAKGSGSEESGYTPTLPGSGDKRKQKGQTKAQEGFLGKKLDANGFLKWNAMTQERRLTLRSNKNPNAHIQNPLPSFRPC